MSTEVFRFVTIRPPQQPVDSQPADRAIPLGNQNSPLVDSLRRLRPSNSRAKMVDRVKQFNASADYVDSTRQVDKKYLDLAAALRRLPDATFWAGALAAFKKIFDANPADIIKTDAFLKLSGQVADSVLAATIDGSIPPKPRSLLVALARALWVINRLATNKSVSRSDFTRAPLVLPDGIFPLPVAGLDLKAQRQAAADAEAKYRDDRKKQLAQLSADLDAHHRAIDELLTTFEKTGVEPAANPAVNRTAAATASKLASGFTLPDSAAARLSDATKAVLQGSGVAATQIDVAKSVSLLEKQAAGIANRIYTDTGTIRSMVRVGSRIIPSDLFGNLPPVVLNPGDLHLRSPGECPPAPATNPVDDTASIPTGHGEGRILGIADLMVLEQSLLRYELGEIAHIENVLKSETRSRKFKTSTTTTESQLTEGETTREKEQDLSSTERFELQTESQTVINESASKDAGLTIHASYGPSVDATANFNYSSNSSKEESTRASSTYAREVATKAVDRVQTRTLTRRTVTTVNVIEEVNEHGFDNKAGSGDITGIYRFVDKIYLAQVVNYGKRLMLEFVVPEPAAFLRYAMTNRPLSDVSAPSPEPPGYCLADGKSFVPLQAQDITRDNYLFWASKYGAQDVTAAPPRLMIASGSKKAPESLQTVPSDGDRKINSDLFDVTIADGYLCQSAFVNIYGETQVGQHAIVIQLQDQQGRYAEPGDDGHLFYLHLQPTPTVTVTINSIGFHNYEVLATVFCTLSAEAFANWQFKTFSSIMNAYNDLKSRYDQSVAEARLQAGDATVGGTNPLNNRATEQKELKKGCISLLTGQRFELFDAVNRNVAPYGYPEVDFVEAKAESIYIEMFEQSFEWNNMTYLFYPYFWGRKEDWVAISQLTDDDPLFGMFLQAGAARVQVPVRIGFEQAILTYLSTGEIWNGEGTILTHDGDEPDPLHLSILDELKSQLGNNNIEGVGSLNVAKNDANVTGVGTAFTSDDEKRRIAIAGKLYVIQTVTDAFTIRLTTPYPGPTATGLGYSMGGKHIGEPWEVRLPTDLVKLDNTLVITSSI